jgi:hypothetical protein
MNPTVTLRRNEASLRASDEPAIGTAIPILETRDAIARVTGSENPPACFSEKGM